MESNIKLSIIVAVYGVENYIEESISSFLPQLNSEIECIFINDGTKDRSMDVLHKYLSDHNSYEFVKIIEQENQGLSVARNNAIKQAKGRYITFIDSDDCVVENYVEKIVNIINENNNIDLIQFNGFVEGKNKKIEKLEIVDKTCIAYVDEIYLNKLFEKNKWFVCFRVFKKELLGNFTFPEGFYYADMLSIPFLYSKDISIYDLAEPLYIYKYRSTSSVRMKLNDKHLNSLIYGLEKFREFREIEYMQKVYIHLIVGLFNYYLSQSFKSYLDFVNFIKNNDLKFIEDKIEYLHWKKELMLRHPKLYYMYKNYFGVR